MTQGKTTLITASVCQNKYLINKDNFVEGGGLAKPFIGGREAHGFTLTLKTLTDMRGAYSGVFL